MLTIKILFADGMIYKDIPATTILTDLAKRFNALSVEILDYRP